MVLLEMVGAIDRKKFEPIVLCPTVGELSKRLDEISVPVVIRRGVQLSKCNVIRFAADVMWLRRWLRNNQIALIHINSGAWRTSVSMAAKTLRIPTILHVHNPSKIKGLNFSRRWADRILVVSDDVGRPFREDPFFQHKTQTIYNSVDLSRYDESSNWKTQIGVGNNPVIGFVGQIVPRKGLDILIEAMPAVVKSYPNAMLVIVGFDPSETCDYEQHCRSLIADRRLEKHTYFAGFRDDVPAWMRSFDVFVLPTRSEAFGKVIIEAMAAGCPIVATRVGGIPEIIQSADLGALVPVDDHDATARAILYYLDYPEKAKQVAENAGDLVRKRFSRDAMIDQLQLVYAELINRK